MKKILIALVTALMMGGAYAQSSSVANQTSQSQSVAQGTIQFSQTPEHTTETVRNVSAPVLGAYAGSFSQMGCGSTTQGGMAFAGFSVVGGTSVGMKDCVLEVAAAETVRQSTVTEDPGSKAALQAAAVAIRCQVSAEVYKAYQAAGLDCKGLKPAGLETREDTQPANYRVAGN